MVRRLKPGRHLTQSLTRSVLEGGLLAIVLQDYTTLTQFFLRDSNFRIWTQSQLNICINRARRDMVADTGCCRDICTFSLIQGQEYYSYSNFVLPALQQLGPPQLSAASIFDILDLKLFYTSVYKPPLLWRPWNRFSAIHRGYDYQMIPAVWSQQNISTGFYVRPIPNMAYTLEVRCVWVPPDLVNLSDVEQFFFQPYQDLVAMLAASYAFEYKNDTQRAFEKKLQYIALRDEKLGAHPSFRVPSYYSRSAA